jgi:DnaJ homolog subfamily A member 2
MPKDTKLYDLLNVSPTANENDIRKAYYKLAKIHHPDKLQDKDEAAEEKFKEIKFAYEVLTDKTKRDTYDRFGLEGLKDGVGGTEFEDIFSHLFGGFGGGGFGGGGNPFFPFDIFGGGMGGGRGRGAKRRTQNMVYPLKVTLAELYNGATKEIELERSTICSGCEGTGGKPGATQTCKSCAGRGFSMQYKQIGPGMVQQMQAMCRECSGQGELINEKDRCKECSGKKTSKQKKKFEVHVDKGMQDSQKITFRGESNQEPGVDTGDLIVVLQQTDHDVFTRNHDDLFMSHTINITEALCGFKIVVKHLDDRTLVLNQPAGEVLSPGTIRAIPSEGMPIYKNPYEKGNLYVKFDVKFPENNTLTEEQISKLETLLPPKPKVEIPSGDHVDEVSMVDYESTKGSSKSSGGGARGFREAYSGDDDDDDEPAGQRVECNTH